MNLCREVAEKLLLFRDGNLPEVEEPFIREHLQYCPPCLDLLNSYEEVCDVLRRLKPVNMPPDLIDRMKERMRRKLAGEAPEASSSEDDCCGEVPNSPE